MLLNNIGFWVAWLLPLLVLIAPYLAARQVWRNAAPMTVTTENARTPAVAGISVLAIAVPLVANLALEVSKTTENLWIVGVLLAAMTYALVALWIGMYLVFKFSLESRDDQVQISPSVAPWMTLQNGAIVLFVTASFTGLIIFIISARFDSSPPSQGAQQLTSSPSSSQGAQQLTTSTKPLPVPGSDKSEILEAWGKPDVQGKTWLTYRTADSTVVFCLEDLEDTALVDKVIMAEAKEDPNAVRMDCTTYR